MHELAQMAGRPRSTKRAAAIERIRDAYDRTLMRTEVVYRDRELGPYIFIATEEYERFLAAAASGASPVLEEIFGDGLGADEAESLQRKGKELLTFMERDIAIIPVGGSPPPAEPFDRSRPKPPLQHLLGHVKRRARDFGVSAVGLMTNRQGTRSADNREANRVRALIASELMDRLAASYQQIARVFGVSRPRAVQLVREGRRHAVEEARARSLEPGCGTPLSEDVIKQAEAERDRVFRELKEEAAQRRSLEKRENG